jgi:hypothetical protein
MALETGHEEKKRQAAAADLRHYNEGWTAM